MDYNWAKVKQVLTIGLTVQIVRGSKEGEKRETHHFKTQSAKDDFVESVKSYLSYCEAMQKVRDEGKEKKKALSNKMSA